MTSTHQLGTESHVVSGDSFSQLITSRTTQQTPVMTPRLIKRQSPIFLRRDIRTRAKMRMGYAASKKSEIAEMTDEKGRIS